MRNKAIPITLLILLATGAVWAGEGRIPVYEPIAISTPGVYVLTRDVIAPAGVIAVDIRVDGVTLNLNGHTITSQGTTSPAIQISGTAGEEKGIIIVSGIINGGLNGILVMNAIPRHLSLADLTITGAAAAAVKVNNLGSLSAHEIIIVNSLIGFDLVGAPPNPILPAAKIFDVSIQAAIGIQCTDAKCSIADSLISAYTAGIILDGAPGSDVTGNNLGWVGNPQSGPPKGMISVLSSPGVRLSGNTLVGSSIGNGNNHGIFVDSTSNDAIIIVEILTGFGDDGIHVESSDCLIKDNLINNNGGEGILLAGQNHVVNGNKLSRNTDYGLFVDSGVHVFLNNILLGNLRGAIGGPAVADLIDGGGNIQ